MRPWLRPELVGTWREIATVLLILVAPFMLASVSAAHHGSSAHYFDSFLSNQKLLGNLAAEASILGLGLVYLKRRGWTPADLRIHFTWDSIGWGLLLMPITLVANMLLVFGVYWLLFLCQHDYLSFAGFLIAHNPQMSFGDVAAVSFPLIVVSLVVNAFLEEIGCTGYAFCQLAAKRGPLFALCLVVPMRMLCHLYQGPAHMAGVGAVFLIYGLWYWRTRNLWTLIFAHAVVDISSITALKIISYYH